jgi:Ribbon-helix-helix protein, copG family
MILYHGLVERTQISLTRDQASRLRRLAGVRRTSMAALIREAVDRAYPPPERVDDRWAAALQAIGGFRSGATDVSAEHDRDLADALGAG